MITMDLASAAAAIAATLLGDRVDGTAGFVGVSTDSRALASGELFVAVRGENFDNLFRRCPGFGRRPNHAAR